ncbi:hypothetical protein EVAR_3601_1 [Eumeta japonica]|uniref:Uncharacterized protein n=1 Tax=Eumeta variegata TaxID=151549 RepID=A0A4C1SYB8_EUMVA|nr:hypothetical protein EVAR_3601_1 [Eumeta japonica]
MDNMWSVVEHVSLATGAAELAVFTAILYWFCTSRKGTRGGGPGLRSDGSSDVPSTSFNLHGISNIPFSFTYYLALGPKL